MAKSRKLKEKESTAQPARTARARGWSGTEHAWYALTADRRRGVARQALAS